MSTYNSLLAAAGLGMHPMSLPSDHEPQRADLTPISAQLEEVEQREEIENVIANTTVSDAVLRECLEVLRRGEQRGYRETQ